MVLETTALPTELCPYIVLTLVRVTPKRENNNTMLLRKCQHFSHFFVCRTGNLFFRTLLSVQQTNRQIYVCQKSMIKHIPAEKTETGQFYSGREEKSLLKKEVQKKSRFHRILSLILLAAVTVGVGITFASAAFCAPSVSHQSEPAEKFPQKALFRTPAAAPRSTLLIQQTVIGHTQRREFTFYMTVTDTKGRTCGDILRYCDGPAGQICTLYPDQSGRYIFSLQDGDKVLFSLPKNCRCTVEEEQIRNCRTTVHTDSGRFIEGRACTGTLMKETTLNFQNRQAVAPSADASGGAAPALLTASAGLAIWALYQKQHTAKKGRRCSEHGC